MSSERWTAAAPSRSGASTRRLSPPQEKIPFDRLMEASGSGRARFLAAYDGDDLVGIMYLIEDEAMGVIPYLAVREPVRDCGYGSGMLRHLADEDRDRALVVVMESMDVEADNMRIRRRRNEFYNRAEYFDTGYRLRVGGELYDILSRGAFDPERYRSLTSCLADPGEPAEFFKK